MLAKCRWWTLSILALSAILAAMATRLEGPAFAGDDGPSRADRRVKAIMEAEKAKKDQNSAIAQRDREITVLKQRCQELQGDLQSTRSALDAKCAELAQLAENKKKSEQELQARYETDRATWEGKHNEALRDKASAIAKLEAEKRELDRTWNEKYNHDNEEWEKKFNTVAEKRDEWMRKFNTATENHRIAVANLSRRNGELWSSLNKMNRRRIRMTLYEHDGFGGVTYTRTFSASMGPGVVDSADNMHEGNWNNVVSSWKLETIDE